MAADMSFIHDKTYNELWKAYYSVIHEPFEATRIPSWLPFWDVVSPNKILEEQLVDDIKQASEHK